MVRIIREDTDRSGEMGIDLDSSRWTANVMEQAPVAIFVFNAHGEHTPGMPPCEDESDVVDV